MLFFGWTNIKWFLREVNKIYSESEKSFFSKKRIESGVAFILGQWGMVHWLVMNVDKIDVYAVCLWAGLEFTVCGYVLNKIEKLKQPQGTQETTQKTDNGTG